MFSLVFNESLTFDETFIVGIKIAARWNYRSEKLLNSDMLLVRVTRSMLRLPILRATFSLRPWSYTWNKVQRFLSVFSPWTNALEIYSTGIPSFSVPQWFKKRAGSTGRDGRLDEEIPILRLAGNQITLNVSFSTTWLANEAARG